MQVVETQKVSSYFWKRYSANRKTIKFCGLIGCSSNDKFDEKLESLKAVWDARELLSVSEKPKFYDWLIAGKIDSFSMFFYSIVCSRNQKSKLFF